MPIKPIVLQRRHAELGRIRLGYKASTANGGERPAKLETFRFTSVSQRYIEDLATLYGGEPRPWDNNGIASWEVYTTAKSVPVIAVKGGLSQWMEYWSGGGCIHRCDGETNVLTGEPCDLDEKVKVRVRGKDVFVNPHTEARPTTRLSLMLPELDAIGVWRCETHGWNAAAEIPAVAELAQFVGDLVPAHLHLVERRSIKDGQTSRFVVPVLDLQIGTKRLRELVAEKAGLTAIGSASGGEQPAAIEAGRHPDYSGRAVNAKTVDQVRDIWNEAKAAGHLTDDLKTHLTARVNALKTTAGGQPNVGEAGASTPPVSPTPDAEGVYEAQVVEDLGNLDPDIVWEHIVKAGGDRDMTLADIEDDFARQMGGLVSSDASAEELDAYLKILTARPAA